MNNFTFGDSNMGYYETIAGGAGAGPTWHGRSGVHTHMTNTRITGKTRIQALDLSAALLCRLVPTRLQHFCWTVVGTTD